MQDNDLPDLPLPSTAKILEVMGVWIRGLCSLAGLVVLAVGLYLAVRVFYNVYDVAMHPERSAQLVDQWAQVLGAESLKIQIAPDQTVDFGRLAGMGVLISSAFLMGILSCTMMITGARIVCWTTSDRQAVKAIVEYAIERRSGGGP